jgi:hypothetical protein
MMHRLFTTTGFRRIPIFDQSTAKYEKEVSHHQCIFIEFF